MGMPPFNKTVFQDIVYYNAFVYFFCRQRGIIQILNSEDILAASRYFRIHLKLHMYFRSRHVTIFTISNNMS